MGLAIQIQKNQFTTNTVSPLLMLVATQCSVRHLQEFSNLFWLKIKIFCHDKVGQKIRFNNSNIAMMTLAPFFRACVKIRFINDYSYDDKVFYGSDTKQKKVMMGIYIYIYIYCEDY